MRILIIGASGYLGSTLYGELSENSNYDVVGTCNKSDNQQLIKINMFNISDIKRMLTIKPDVIIWCIMDKQRETLLSQIGLSEVVDSISEDVRLIYVSTTIGKGKDQHEGVIPFYRKPDEYIYEYINGKIEGEKIVQKHKNHVIVRPGSIYGFGSNGNMDCRMETLLELSKTDKEYNRTANLFASFVNVKDLAAAIKELAFNKFTGIINIASERPVSHFEFNKYLAKLMNIDDSFIKPDYKQKDTYHNLTCETRKAILQTKIQEIL